MKEFVKVFIAELIRDGYRLIEDRPYEQAQIWTDGRMDFVLFYDDCSLDFFASEIHIEESDQ